MSPRPVVFNPEANTAEALFAKWVKIYIGQIHLNDEEARQFELQLVDLEKAIDDQPLATMHTFFHHLTVTSIFGDFGDTYSQERMKQIYAVAMAEVNERESLLAAIELHKATFNRCNGFTTNDDDDTDDNQEFQSLCDRELDLIKAVVDHPTSSVSNIALKGRYLAAVQNVGGLGFDQAQAFIGTLMEGE